MISLKLMTRMLKVIIEVTNRKILNLIRRWFHSKLSHRVEFEPKLTFHLLNINALINSFNFDFLYIHIKYNSLSVCLNLVRGGLNLKKLCKIFHVEVYICLNRLIIIDHKEAMFDFDLDFNLRWMVLMTRLPPTSGHICYNFNAVWYAKSLKSFLWVKLKHILSEFTPFLRAVNTFLLADL